jgi:hypothetical protein
MMNTPYRMRIEQIDDTLKIEKTFIVEWGNNRQELENLPLDGTALKSTIWNAPRVTTASWTEKKDSLLVKSTITFSRGDAKFKIQSKTTWTLKQRGNLLSVQLTADTFQGKRNTTMIYTRY